MTIKVVPFELRDCEHGARIEKSAYAGTVLSPVLFPGPSPPDSLSSRAEGFATEYKEDSTGRWWKVVDTDGSDGQQMIAFAKWHIWDPKPVAQPRSGFGEGCNVPACEEVFGGIAELQERLLSGQSGVYLHYLQTDPEHQRRGAAKMLIQACVADAAQRGFHVYLQSTPEAHGVYKSCGFEDMEAHTVDLAKYGGPGLHSTYLMQKACET